MTKEGISLSNERMYMGIIKKFALYKENTGQELPVEPVEMSTLVESMKQEAYQYLVDG